MEQYFYSFNDYLQEKYGQRVQRLSLNAGFTCPTRDGKIDTEGCIYCNEKGFSPSVGTRLSLEKQAEKAIDFAKRRYKAERFIAYFQNATNTYAPCSKLKKAYDIIKHFPDVVGLYISTRPDCIDKKKLDLIESYSQGYDVWVEYGLQSAHDRTLKFINRHHTFHDFVEAVDMTAKRNIKVGAHVILGLPGETREDMVKTAEKIAGLPVSGIKLHILHVLKGTKLEKYYNKGDVHLLPFGKYVNTVCDFLEATNPRCVIFRLVSDANPDFLVAPKWINRKSEVINAIKEEFQKRNTKQGYLWKARSLLAFFLFASIFLCCAAGSAVLAGEKIRAVVTILPQAEFVEKVGGEYTDVLVTVPRGTDPHTYEPTPLQFKKIGDADLYFKLGSGVEFERAWMDKIASLNKNLIVINTSEGVELLGGDPHIWLSPKNVIIMVRNIKNAFIMKDPQHKTEYQKNAEGYIKELSKLDETIRKKLADKKSRLFIVFHPSWGYFARDYNLSEIPIEVEGKEPTIAGLKNVIDKAKENGVKAIFTSPQFSRKSAEAVAKEINGKVVPIDPLSKDYVENLEYVADTLEKEID